MTINNESSESPGPKFPDDIEAFELQQYLSTTGTEIDLETARKLLYESEGDSGFVIADEQIAETVRWSGYRLTNADAAADIAEGNQFVEGVLAHMVELRVQSDKVVDDKGKE